MSQPNPEPNGQLQEVSLATAELQYQQTMKVFGKVIEYIIPWLFEVGSWIFGGLIALTGLVWHPSSRWGPWTSQSTSPLSLLRYLFLSM